MKAINIACLLASMSLVAAESGDGYRGIWYQIKGAYSGGMATYPQHQMPMAVYAAKVNATFFVYGGEPASGKKNLQIMIGVFDHKRKMLANPTLVRDCSTSDAHANPSIAIDAAGYIYVYSAARHKFQGRIYRSKRPYDHREFDQLMEGYIPYPQAWINSKGQHFLKYTKYKGGAREIFATVSQTGSKWDLAKPIKLANGGHYAATYMHKDRIWMALNWHKGGSDNRTNLYVVGSDDMGKSWFTADGKPVPIPMDFPGTPGLIRDYLSEKKYIYLNDLIVDGNGYPVVLYVEASGGSKTTGPKGDPRRWKTARFDGTQWHFHPITTVDHNYDYGNLRISDDGVWRAIGATDPGPHPYTIGGDVVLWESRDTGKTWERVKTLTQAKDRNHSYIRIPYQFRPEFYAYWADGDTTKRSESELYFCDWEGNVFRMPRSMQGMWAKPIPVR